MYCRNCRSEFVATSFCPKCGHVAVRYVDSGKTKKTIWWILGTLAVFFVVGLTATVLIVVRTVKTFMSLEQSLGASVPTLPLPHNIAYTIKDLGFSETTPPEFGIANSNNDHAVTFLSAKNNQSGSVSVLEDWDAKAQISIQSSLQVGDLCVLDTNIHDQTLCLGDNAIYLWSPKAHEETSPEALSSFDGTFQHSYAGQLNDSGVVVGGSEISNGITRACEWTSDSPIPHLISVGLPNSCAYEVAENINNVGNLAINAMEQKNGEIISNTYLLKHGRMTFVSGLPGFEGTIPCFINDKDEIVGNMFAGATQLGYDPHADHAFLWEHGQTKDIGTLGTRYAEAWSNNDSSQIVGTCYDNPLSSASSNWQLTGARAFLWEGGTMYDLNSYLPAGSPWVLEIASQINNHRQIVGLGSYYGAEGRAFVMTPMSR